MLHQDYKFKTVFFTLVLILWNMNWKDLLDFWMCRLPFNASWIEACEISSGMFVRYSIRWYITYFQRLSGKMLVFSNGECSIGTMNIALFTCEINAVKPLSLWCSYVVILILSTLSPNTIINSTNTCCMYSNKVIVITIYCFVFQSIAEGYMSKTVKSNSHAQKIHACKYTPVCIYTPVCKSTWE